jgi:putative ABC transport system permease protein
MGSLLQDIRYSLRGLFKSPGFVTVVILSLALGIGANTTIFSVINVVMYRPMPYVEPARLVTLWDTIRTHPGSRMAPPILVIDDLRRQNRAFEDIAQTSFTATSNISGLGTPEPIRLQYVTPNFFSVLGAQPQKGRVFLQSDLKDEAQTIVISDAYWRRRFNADPGILGKTVTIQGLSSTIVGIMPAGFAPFYGDRIDLWWPINPRDSRYSARADHWLMAVARLKPGVSFEAAQSEADRLALQLEHDYPKTSKGIAMKVAPLHSILFDRTAHSLYPLFGAVAFILLIACLNVANLVQSRTETRRKEYALRAALGAQRSRLIRQMLIESALLALSGAAVGVAVAVAGIALFRKLAVSFPNAASIRIDGPVLLFALGITMLTVVLFGMLPALKAANPNLNIALQDGERGASAPSRGRVRHILVISEVALAMVLLIGAGLMIRTVLRIQQVDPGFDSKNVTTMDIQLPAGGKYIRNIAGSDTGTVLPLVPAFYNGLIDKVTSLPGVDSAGIISLLPTHGGFAASFSILGHPAADADHRPLTGYNDVSPGLFQALKIPLRRGRIFEQRDTGTAPWGAVISETFARRYFPRQDPIGQQLLLRYEGYGTDEPQPRQIIGVVGDVKNYDLVGESAPFVYLSWQQQPSIMPGGTVETRLHEALVVRTSSGFTGNQAELAASVKKAVAELDPDQPVTDVMPMEQALSDSISDSRFYMRLLEIFAGIALLLATIGIYGVISYHVSQRTREFGIRFALGASPADVLSLVTGLGLRLTATGVLIGALLAVGMARLIAGLLFGVKPADPLTYILVAVGLITVALAACYLPARRAAKVDPIVALRYE